MAIDLLKLFPGKAEKVREVVESVFESHGEKIEKNRNPITERASVYRRIKMFDGRYLEFLPRGDRVYFKEENGSVILKIYVPFGGDTE